MNCNVHVFYKMIFSNKFGLIPEASLFLYIARYMHGIHAAASRNLYYKTFYGLDCCCIITS